MNDRLRSENEALRRQLEALLQEARRNEEKMRRFDQLERRLISTRSLAELIRMLLADYKTAFDLDAVTLTLIDPEYEIARLLDIENADQGAWPGLQFQDEGCVLENLYGGASEPLLGTYDAGRHAVLFGDVAPPASIALLPLACQGRLIGSLNLGSRAIDRFTADSGTEFLGRLAAIAAVSLENALNQERLQLIGLTDPLTGVNNRRYFECRLEEEITRARRHGLSLTCMFIDIDKFKRINDTLGHQAGDEVLRKVASLIKGQLRGSDVIARYGGEEFVALLPQTAIRHAIDIAERMRARLAGQLMQPLRGESLRVTVSIGVSTLPDESGATDASKLAERLVQQADKALYQAKQGGRNRVVSELAPDSQPVSLPYVVRTALSAMLR